MWKTDPTLPPPSPPPGYGKGEYVLPIHETKPLEVAHPHERDKQIVFHEKPHVYVVRDTPCEVSVTGIVSPFCEEFDEEEAIRKMKVSRREVWPKLKYAVGAKCEEGEEAQSTSCNFLCVDSSGKTLGKGSTPSEAKGMASKKRKRGEEEEECTLYSYERPMTDQEILDEWDRNREEAANRGTEAHYQLELWMNSLPCREDAVEVKNGLSFIMDQLAPIGFKPYRTEWEIFSDEEQVAGSIDLVGTAPDPAFKEALLSALPSSAPDSLKRSILSLSGYDLRDACGEWMDYSLGERTTTSSSETGVIGEAIRLIEEGWIDADRIERVNDLCGMKLVVVDWKRAKSHEIHTQYDKKMRNPLQHLDDTSISKYAIQLSIYTYILEKRMGYSVLCLCLAGVHPDHPFHTWVPYLRREVDFLMTARQKRIQAKECVRSKAMHHHLLHRCPISKDIAWNPVREEGGGETVYDKTYACLEFPNKTFVQDKASLLQVEDALSSSQDPPPSRIEGSLPWKTIMPPLGHRDWIHKDVFREL